MQLKSETTLNLLLVALLAFSVAYFLSSLALLKLPPCFHLNLSLKTPATKLPTYDYMVAREGFFKPKKKTAVARPQPVKRKEVFTLAGYSLKGTVVCGQCGHSIAILAAPDGRTVVLSVGSNLKNYTLKAVYPDKAVFESGGREVVLRLFKKEQQTAHSRPVNTLSPQPLTSSTLQYKVSRKEIISQISSGDFLRYINIVPTKNPPGLRVNYVNPRSFIYKLGIRPGDIITSINGIEIRTPEDSFSAFEQLKNADTVTVTVLRRGKELKLHYEIE
ncbi:general secretion pathway protein C [Thermovibrio ammonificans HB-1]|uniref:General secretion pathway protein C n=1 Tax=Thermovibrio ammonificans (strain DSM 15698 / JCM 12110 / HB-1) TaxID=648996 RepID=E8T1W7_THEA1|nr:PDZ domain-containing protein [Thermovibrio ammonificans]ADU96862.1 general secretion pathway protein C [Thermovibrio ammonificans HB-1]